MRRVTHVLRIVRERFGWGLVAFVAVTAVTGLDDTVIDWLAPKDLHAAGRLIVVYTLGGAWWMYHLSQTINGLRARLDKLQHLEAD